METQNPEEKMCHEENFNVMASEAESEPEDNWENENTVSAKNVSNLN